MPKVSFYIIGEHSERSVDSLVCQLSTKAATQSAVELVLPTQALAHYDALLWSFDETSFLPHGINDSTAKINLSAEPDPKFSGIVINLTTSELLLHYAQRIIEVIAADEESKTAGRHRYKAYKQAGFTLETFNV